MTETLSKINLDSNLEYFSYNNLTQIYNNINKGNIMEDGPLENTPNNIKLDLKIHQKRILYEMLKKENIDYRVSSGLNCFVLSDKVGSGKSIDILSLIAKKPLVNNIMNNKLKYKVTKYSDFKGFNIIPTINIKSNLIIVPHNIFNQWENYIINYTNLKFFSIKNKKDLLLLNKPFFEKCNYNIILIKSTKYQEFSKILYNLFPMKTKIKENKILSQKKINELHKNVAKLVNYNDNNNIFLNTLIDIKNIVNDFNIDDLKKKIEINGDYKLYWLYEYNGPIFERVFIDEANSIKVPRFKCIYGKFNWFITSSMEDLFYPNGISRTNKSSLIGNNNGIRGTGFIRDTFLQNSSKNFCNFLQDMYLKNNDLFIEKSFKLPEPNIIKILCHTPPEIKALTGVAIPAVLKALSAGDFDSAIKSIGCDVTTEEDLVKNILINLENSLNDKKNILKKKQEIFEQFEKAIEDLQNQITTNNNEILLEINNISDSIYNLSPETNNNLLPETDDLSPETDDLSPETDDLLIEASDLSLETNNIFDNLNDTNLNQKKIKLKLFKKKKYGIKKSIKIITEQINEIQFKLTSLKNRISNVAEKECPICTLKVSGACMTPCCKNIFCTQCVIMALNYSKQCPLCREKINVSDLTVIQDNKNEKTEEILPKKIESLINIIKNNNGKFLIFSEYDNTFSNILNELNYNKITYSKLCGSSGHITNIIEKFKNNQLKVLLLNAKYFGSGLNLEMTTDVILYHRMSIDLEKQIIGRAQRPGRQTKLNIHYLCYDNEINDPTCKFD